MSDKKKDEGKAYKSDSGASSDSTSPDEAGGAGVAGLGRLGRRRRGRRRRRRLSANPDAAAGYKVEKADLSRLITLFTKFKCTQIGIKYKQLRLLLLAATRCLEPEPSLIEVQGPVTIFGNLYGQYNCLWKLITIAGFPPSEQNKYIFLGNYGSRGNMGLETLILLLMLKVRWPNYVFLLRGNHECGKMAEVFGLKEVLQYYVFVYDAKEDDELVEKVGKKPRFRGRYDDTRSQVYKLWRAITRMFDYLPLAATVGGKVLCVNGGLSPEIVHEQGLDHIRAIRRPVEVPASGLVTDLLWACPVEEPYGFNPSTDGITMCFGPDVVNKFCEATGVQLIVRSLQIPANGHVFNPTEKVITIFSAVELLEEHKHENIAAILYLDSTLKGVIKRYSVEPPKDDRATVLASLMTRIGTNVSKDPGDKPSPDGTAMDLDNKNMETERPENVEAFGEDVVQMEKVNPDATIMGNLPSFVMTTQNNAKIE